MPTRVVGFISEKGGVGKTTACYHIAIDLKRNHNKNVLVIDTDYQRGGITCRFIPSLIEKFQKGEIPYSTIYHEFQSLYADSEAEVSIDILKGSYNIDLIPSDPRLTRVTVDKLPGSRDVTKLSAYRYRHLSIIADLISRIKKDHKYDYILIDTHPEISDLLDSVIFACDYCVSPVKLDRQSSIGVSSTVEAINNNVKKLESLLEISSYSNTVFIGAIPMMAREYGEDLIWSMNQEYKRLQNAYGSTFESYVSYSRKLRRRFSMFKYGNFQLVQ